MTDGEKELLEALEPLLAEGPEDEFLGICNWLNAYSDQAQEAFYNLSQQWPEYTGRKEFPIPHPSLNPQEAYRLTDEPDMWSREHPYGTARWRLVEWCIEQLKGASK